MNLEPTTLMSFNKPKQSEGPYSEKSPAELQMILNDARKWKDAKVEAAIQAEIDTRNGVRKKELVKAIKEVETAVKAIVKPEPKKRVRKPKL